ncbi:alpha-L-arabinofuranosidase [Sphingobacterium paramultivorum]|uniref:non-reducing end alpha-L-arabinofuranosidase n=1 Tax=Sphingobacterium paramultivorum TaxID=2886510 RepID=A0A7G5E8L8_9SPHI|nr:alpha-L-arabinofuranosidase C-terminal domain-containing protein [Sphingobacterium paramultivorum]QMV70343.1 alpha-L-arabinofuranosidase [Sphingobacterium paramultivorum]WSO14196.1 alpha-L-arabinofuranosidase C-terminal domain-containing protein [Sphingobacterium paramultivorum]
MKRVVSILLLLASLGSSAMAQSPITLNIALDKPTGKISPHMWGVFFEDINLGSDGGIYAELVKNRSFEFDQPWMGWKKLENGPEGTYLLLNDSKRKGNKRYLRINNAANLKLGLQNEGFRGMGVKAGAAYEFSVQYQSAAKGMKIHVELLDQQNKVIGAAELPLEPVGSWSEATVKFPVNQTTDKAKLNVWFTGAGTLDVDMLSLFPIDTWKGRPKGLRKDMVQMLADMKPGFIRFPGGCIVEGKDLANRFQWKKTVGPITERELIINRWNTEFSHRLTPDYFQTFGLGFYEYFLLAEDIGASPVPILNCGMACQFNTAELVPLDELDTYVQDALDLIEFANGTTDTKWGKLRADMGHPEPFHLKMLGVGNENWGPQYIERLAVFKKALNEKHPEIKIIASSGTDPEGDRFDFLNDQLRAMNINIIDEHYYRPPSWFLSSANRYDNYTRNGVKIFAGEYASHTTRPNGPGKSTWEAALSEAAFMTGLERNGDVVEMASYAPLFGHVDGWQWSPDLIWVDNLQVYGTPSYQVQKLYATNKGTNIVPIKRDGEFVAGKDSLYASAVFDAAAQQLIVKVVNYNSKPMKVNLDVDSKKKPAATAEKITLANANLNLSNSIEEPLNIRPKQNTVTSKGKTIVETFEPYSLTLIKLTVK